MTAALLKFFESWRGQAGTHERSEVFMATVADEYAATLAVVGVKRIYGTVGDGLNGLTEAFGSRERSIGCTSGTRR
jgi:hypothetical protein